MEGCFGEKAEVSFDVFKDLAAPHTFLPAVFVWIGVMAGWFSFPLCVCVTLCPQEFGSATLQTGGHGVRSGTMSNEAT